MERLTPQRNGPRVQSLSVDAGSDWFVIDGQTNPELFMPTELFNALLQGLWDDEQVRTVNRQTLAPGIRAFGFDEAAFWTKLDEATSSYRDQVRVRNRKKWSQTRAELSQGTPTPMDRQLCQARVATLESLREIFRTEGFDRFLYSVVAPTISISTSATRETPEKLLNIERGCQ